MTGISTGVSLLKTPNADLKSSVKCWYELDTNTSNSASGSHTLTFNGVGDGSASDFQIITSDSKLGIGCLQTLQFEDSLGYYVSADTTGSERYVGSLCGWFKLITTIGTNPNFVFYPFMMSTSFNSNPRVGDFGLNAIGTNAWTSRTSLPLGFQGGSSLVTADFSGWVFLYFAYNFTDTSQGANGSQYFSVNNGTLYASATPAVGLTTYLQGIGVMDVDGWSSVAQHAFGVRYDGVAVFDRTLTPSEISYIYNSGSGRLYSAL